MTRVRRVFPAYRSSSLRLLDPLAPPCPVARSSWRGASRLCGRPEAGSRLDSSTSRTQLASQEAVACA